MRYLCYVVYLMSSVRHTDTKSKFTVKKNAPEFNKKFFFHLGLTNNPL